MQCQGMYYIDKFVANGNMVSSPSRDIQLPRSIRLRQAYRALVKRSTAGADDIQGRRRRANSQQCDEVGFDICLGLLLYMHRS